MRYYNGKPVELLAPAGNFDIFKSIVESKCDAIYFGGQQLNMRLIRKGFNFTDEELKEAIEMARSKGKMTYITVNNLVDFEELEIAKQYLTYLDSIQPDALIVQDFAILKLIKDLGLSLKCHASVMMNVHNLPMIQALERYGVERVVLSRETPLSDAAWFKANSEMELEYFTHGDMCVAHGAQCYHSAMVFGMSSNRGRCLKPCRWWYNDGQFPLAVKDMCMYEHLREMLAAGITSFKIEGRMREKEFITDLINRYGDAFDRLIADPVGYDPSEGFADIYEGRKRDLSTAYAFGNPGASNLNERYEGTGKFYSTGKMFSTPTATQFIEEEAVEKVLAELLTEKTKDKGVKTKLSVKVQTKAQAESALNAGAARVYISSEAFLPNLPVGIEALKTLKALADETQAELYYSLPRMMNDEHFKRFKAWLPLAKPYLHGLLVGNLGALEAFKHEGLDLRGDFGLNVYNPVSASFYEGEGLSGFTASVELPAKQLSKLISLSKSAEVIVHGAMTTMYLEHDLYDANNQAPSELLVLSNEAGEFSVYKDGYGRNHLMNSQDLCLLPVIEGLKGQAEWLRIEAQLYDPETVEMLVRTYNSALDGNVSPWEDFVDHTLGAIVY